MQLKQEVFQKDESCVNQKAIENLENFMINDLKAQLQNRDTTTRKLKDSNKSLRKNSKKENVNHDKCDLEPINEELENSVAKLLLENERLCNEINHVKQVFKDQFNSIKQTRVQHKEHSNSLVNKLNLKSVENKDLKAQIQEKELLVYVRDTCPNAITPSAKKVAVKPMNNVKKVRFAKPLISSNNIKKVESSNKSDSNTSVLSSTRVKCSTSNCESKPPVNKKKDRISQTPSRNKKNKVEAQPRKFNKQNYVVKPVCDVDVKQSLSNVVQIVLWYLDSGCPKHMIGNRSQLMNFISKFPVEGLGHNLFSVGQFCDADLEIAFRKNTCFIRNLEGVDLLSRSRGINLYIISINDMLKSSLICLLSKASKIKSWLWHRQLSHLNFGTLNKLAKDGLTRGIPRLKFQKDHLCLACALAKSKKSSHQPQAEDTNQEKLSLLHMDLCGPMRVASINVFTMNCLILD
ncbi:retrovirus-related pol polyprotein from transposon TNT 1-94 [Tanacetum coccineum]